MLQFLEDYFQAGFVPAWVLLPIALFSCRCPSTRKDECLVFLRGGAFTPAGRLLALSAPSSVVEGLERSLLNVQSHGIYNVFGQRLWFLHTHLILIFGTQLFLHLFCYLPCTFLKMSKQLHLEKHDSCYNISYSAAYNAEEKLTKY